MRDYDDENPLFINTDYNPADEGRVAREDRQAGLAILLVSVLTVGLVVATVVMLVRG